MQQRIPSRSRFRRLSLILFALLVIFLVRFNLTIYNLFPASHPDTTTTTALLTALHNREKHYKLIADAVVYDRYARVYSRRIRFPNNQEFDYDIWGRVWRNDSFGVVTVVPFDRPTHTFTLIREYNIAHAKFTYGFPQGQMELAKHGSIIGGAAAELEEEAHLKCRNWVDLLNGKAAPQDKYQRERVWFYLCPDAVSVVGGRERDEEEDMDIVRGVTEDQIRDLVVAGVMQSNQIAAALLALDRLKKMRLVSL